MTVIIGEDFEHVRDASVQLNEEDSAVVERRQRAERLRALLDTFDKEDGPIPHDPAEDARLARLLGSAE